MSEWDKSVTVGADTEAKPRTVVVYFRPTCGACVRFANEHGSALKPALEARGLGDVRVLAANTEVYRPTLVSELQGVPAIFYVGEDMQAAPVGRNRRTADGIADDVLALASTPASGAASAGLSGGGKCKSKRASPGRKSPKRTSHKRKSRGRSARGGRGGRRLSGGDFDLLSHAKKLAAAKKLDAAKEAPRKPVKPSPPSHVSAAGMAGPVYLEHLQNEKAVKGLWGGGASDGEEDDGDEPLAGGARSPKRVTYKKRSRRSLSRGSRGSKGGSPKRRRRRSVLGGGADLSAGDTDGAESDPDDNGDPASEDALVLAGGGKRTKSKSPVRKVRRAPSAQNVALARAYVDLKTWPEYRGGFVTMGQGALGKRLLERVAYHRTKLQALSSGALAKELAAFAASRARKAAASPRRRRRSGGSGSRHAKH